MKNMIELIKKMFERGDDMLKPTNKDITDFLNERWGNVKCPVCGNTDWTIMEGVYELRELNLYAPGVKKPNDNITPLIPVTCNHCGNTLFLNAYIVGLIKDQYEL